MVRNRIQERSEDVRRGRLQHCADISAQGEPDKNEIGSDESVPDVRHGRLHSQSKPERTTILEENIGERSNRSLIVPKELRQHWHGEFDQMGTASEILGLEDPDLDNGASNKVEGETDVTNRSASMIATGSPPMSQDVAGTCRK